MKNNNKSFIDLDNSEIQKIFKQFGADPYILKQINDLIYNKHIQERQEMINIPKELGYLIQAPLNMMLWGGHVHIV